MKYIVDLWLDGYEDEEQRKLAGLEIIRESLDVISSSVEVCNPDGVDRISICPVCGGELIVKPNGQLIG